MTSSIPPGPPDASQGPLVCQVRSAAERLVAELERAEALTGQWSDAAQTRALTQAALSRCLDRLAATGCWGPANRLPSSELWCLAGPWLTLGSLQRHARTKPRGYAGDYQMLEKICTGYLCHHPLGNAFDRFFQSQAAPQAVRNRTQATAEAIVRFVRAHSDVRLRLVSVGCGPARDVLAALRQLTPQQRSRLSVRLMDLDSQALDYARSLIGPWLEANRLECVRENLLRLPQKSRQQEVLGEVDFLVCAGLFDYLDDRAATAMLATFWRHLAPGGTMLCFNFGPANASRAYMEWIGNWYLTYRDRNAMLRLAERAGLDRNEVVLGAEATGANLYWCVSRPSH